MSSVSALLRAVDANDFNEIERLLLEYPEYRRLVSAVFSEALKACSVTNERRFAELCAWSENFLQQQGLKRVHSTLTGETSDCSSMLDFWRSTGEKNLISVSEKLFLHAVPDQFSGLEFHSDDLENGCCIQFLGSFTQNIEDNLYLMVHCGDQTEVLRIGSRGLSLVDAAIHADSNTKIDKLYTVLIQDNVWRVYVNGVLLIRCERSSRLPIRAISLKLMPSVSATLAAEFLSFEVFALGKNIEDPFMNEKALFGLLFSEHLRAGDLLGLYHLMRTLQGLVNAEQAALVWQCMRSTRAHEKGIAIGCTKVLVLFWGISLKIA